MIDILTDNSSGVLPKVLPIFPLAGALLLPRGRLPLHIFEPRYVAMFEDAMADSRMVGMVQPLDPGNRETVVPVYRIGCAGRVTGFRDMENGRYLVMLTGVSRFRFEHELESVRGYRRVEPVWDGFAGDLCDGVCGGFDRGRLLGMLPCFLETHDISANWDSIEGAPDERLVTSLAMICPFQPSEKQALLEAPTLPERAVLLTSLIEMAVGHHRVGDRVACH
ncbi:MAG: LON peptidase substrate-binding domain-containing protein [Rhodospirillaceae bacterium]